MIVIRIGDRTARREIARRMPSTGTTGLPPPSRDKFAPSESVAGSPWQYAGSGSEDDWWGEVLQRSSLSNFA
jgi:hypothetical protein